MTTNSKENEREDAFAPPIIRCHKCGATVAANANYCSNCGAKQTTKEAWYYQPVWILVLALFVLGPFALPLVWKSQKMGRSIKIILAILILAYTSYCVYLTYVITMTQLQQFNEINAIVNDIIKP